jgi:hypothetical protein
LLFKAETLYLIEVNRSLLDKENICKLKRTGSTLHVTNAFVTIYISDIFSFNIIAGRHSICMIIVRSSPKQNFYIISRSTFFDGIPVLQGRDAKFNSVDIWF